MAESHYFGKDFPQCLALTHINSNICVTEDSN